MDFSPEFELLLKFSIGLATTPANEDDVIKVARYLGVDLPDTSLEDHIKILQDELVKQNSFLKNGLESDSVYDSEEYRRSIFVREIVANNRIIRRKRTVSNR